MAIMRWTDPFRDLVGIQERLNQLFGDLTGRTAGREEGLETGMWMPSVDISETKDAVRVRAELPGVDKDAVHVEVKDGILALRGERSFEKESEDENYYRVERAYGKFERSFTLPSSVDGEKVTARMKDGVLDVTLPKKEESKARKIKIAA